MTLIAKMTVAAMIARLKELEKIAGSDAEVVIHSQALGIGLGHNTVTDVIAPAKEGGVIDRVIIETNMDSYFGMRND